MPLIAKTGRSSPKNRALIGSLYALLLLGAVTMIYPFLLMISGSTKSAVDSNTSNVIPRFLTDETALFKKYTEGFFNESLTMMRICCMTNIPSFRNLSLPSDVSPRLSDEWVTFLAQHKTPWYAWQPAFIYTPISRGTIPLNLRRFKKELATLCDGDIDILNAKLNTDFINWNALFIVPRNYLARSIQPDHSPLSKQFTAFKEKLPVSERYYFSLTGYYRLVFLRALYTANMNTYNQAHNTAYRDWNDIPLTQKMPTDAASKEREDWSLFVREIINPLWIKASPEARPLYQSYLKEKYSDIQALNKLYQTDYPAFSDVPLFEIDSDKSGIQLADWNAFIVGWSAPGSDMLHRLPDETISLQSIDFDFRKYLRTKYTSLEQLNRTLGTAIPDWPSIDPPQYGTLFANFKKHKTRWRTEFIVRNYISVVEYILLHGRALMNTVIYCSLSILLSLIVNPLAAYALSRYKPPSAYTVLLFLMLTMAFPPMVTQIPVFLMLRQFNLLNSFFALILPGMANGFSIFLLKGFFDSLPQDLYDSAALDGAGELTIFWQITMSLSKPILAVIALNAFTIAYSNFMMALLICQDEKMWTLMPWLYQLQQRSGQGVIFASLLIAALPTLLVFSFCQNIIMRGIVIPVEK